MPEDRFGDLGEEQPKRSAAERFAEQDRINPEPDLPRRPEVPRPGNRYAWVVGIVMLMGISVLIMTGGITSQDGGLHGPPPGTPVPAFAAPSATGTLEGDANVSQYGDKRACGVRGDDVINSCELRKRPLVLTFVVTRGADCEPQVDRVERMRGEFPQVEFVAVMSGNERDEAERIVSQRRWELPVAVDRDGAVVNLYGVGLCPTTVFARDGRVRKVELGNLTEDQLRKRIRRYVLPRPGSDGG